MATEAELRADNERLRGLIKRAIGSISRLRFQDESPDERPLWSLIMDTFAMGSTSAANLCVEFGFEPDTIVVLREAGRVCAWCFEPCDKLCSECLLCDGCCECEELKPLCED